MRASQLKLRTSLGGIGDQRIHFQRAEVTVGNLYVLLPVQSGVSERFLHEFFYGVGFACADDEIFGGILLDDLVDSFHVFRRVAPVAS